MAFFWGGKYEICSQEGLTAVDVSNQETDFCGAEKVFTALEQRSIENALPIFRPRAHKCALLNPSVSGVRRGGDLCRAGEGSIPNQRGHRRLRLLFQACSENIIQESQ